MLKTNIESDIFDDLLSLNTSDRTVKVILCSQKAESDDHGEERVKEEKATIGQD